MTTVRIWQDRNKTKAFEAFGHSGYSVSGTDIVCAAISILVSNTINS